MVFAIIFIKINIKEDMQANDVEIWFFLLFF